MGIDVAELEERKEDLQQQLREKVRKNEEILNGSRTVPDEEKEEFDARADEIDDLQDDIERVTRTLDQRKFQETPEGERMREMHNEGEEKRMERAEDGNYHEAFVEYVQRGAKRMSNEARDKLYTGHVEYEDARGESRTLTTEVDQLGGFTIPSEFADNIESALKRFGGMRRANTDVQTTDGAGDLIIPTSDDTSNEGEYLGEDQSATEQDINFGRVILGAHVLSTKLVKASVPLLRSGIGAVEDFIEDKLGERFGRRENRAYTTGDGNNKPYGVISASVKGVDASQATGVTEDDVIGLKHSVDPAYRENAEFMCHDSMLLELKLIKDGNGRPLFIQDFRTGNEPILDGDPVIINQDMVDVSSGLSDGQKSLLYGAFEKYMIRQVRTMSLLRLEERYAENWAVGFVGFMQNDGNLLDAGTNPVQYLEQ